MSSICIPSLYPSYVFGPKRCCVEAIERKPQSHTPLHSSLHLQYVINTSLSSLAFFALLLFKPPRGWKEGGRRKAISTQQEDGAGCVLCRADQQVAPLCILVSSYELFMIFDAFYADGKGAPKREGGRERERGKGHNSFRFSLALCDEETNTWGNCRVAGSETFCRGRANQSNNFRKFAGSKNSLSEFREIGPSLPSISGNFVYRAACCFPSHYSLALAPFPLWVGARSLGVRRFGLSRLRFVFCAATGAGSFLTFSSPLPFIPLSASSAFHSLFASPFNCIFPPLILTLSPPLLTILTTSRTLAPSPYPVLSNPPLPPKTLLLKGEELGRVLFIQTEDKQPDQIGNGLLPRPFPRRKLEARARDEAERERKWRT
ncbi:hypothetical protein C7M84_008741 [Penaeus vannamei]|uniref:Uncharacterized protein n=1 Tax=Penaeus vannamei TaxID=6689 RepID=A0A423T8Q4_PENVA|nr:hypothetical protein C7M84_008741 [Penaeus vannamei]